MAKSPIYTHKLYGTSTVGTKGQVVIPVEAREEMKIAAGDRLYVMCSTEAGFITFLKEDALESMMEHLTAQIEGIRALKKEQNKE